MMSNSLFRKLDQLGMHMVQSEMVGTPPTLVNGLKRMFEPKVADMINNETTEFVEGFLAGVLYSGKYVQLGGDLAVQTGEVPVEHTEQVREAQLDTVITLLTTYLLEQRQRD